MRSVPICGPQARSAALLTFGTSPSLTIRKPAGHLLCMMRCASCRPVEAKTSDSDCMENVTRPPASVSRCRDASCPQAATLMVIMARALARTNVLMPSALVEIGSRMATLSTTWARYRRYPLPRFHSLRRMKGNRQYPGLRFSRHGHKPHAPWGNSWEDHRRRRLWGLVSCRLP